MEPANEETGRIPRPQPVPASPPDPPPAFSSASDHDTPPAASHSTPSTSSSPVSSQSPNHSPKQRPVSGIVPPYWSHQRHASRTSQISVDGGPAITLEDHTEDPNCETSRGLWAKSVTIDDHVVVEGKTGIGAYVVWNCRIRTLEGGIITVRMRYSEFDDLRTKLVAAFPHAKNALPSLPPKSVLFKFRPKFLDSRRVGLEYFLNCVLLNPEFASSPIVKDFLFGRTC
ncbi:Phox homologous domain-containing protein [Aspergillus pseudodeflectus]|uniref:Endosomal/vacuolar adapter protein YPT35 n=2 Tax=Aspergillus subgen. Nidulantes TaxID=2720870 RepID=A0A0U5G987_ASPCI|nr:Putative PX domain protein [Aspergillus calidoustus]